jgi:outer membrane protein assembly factor BamD
MKKSYAVLFALMLMTVCGGRKVLTTLEPEDEFKRALSFYESEDYTTAVLAFERILFYHATSEYVDDAQFWLGRTYFEKKDYEQAILELDYLIRNFPNSQFIEQAYLYRAKAYIDKAPGYEKDPTELENAVDLCNQFLTRFPNSKYTEEVRDMILIARKRLAKKELQNGKIYQKLGAADAALLYFNYVIETYPETNASNEARYRAAEIYENRDDKKKALELYKELLNDDKWRDKVTDRVKKIEQGIDRIQDEGK